MSMLIMCHKQQIQLLTITVVRQIELIEVQETMPIMSYNRWCDWKKTYDPGANPLVIQNMIFNVLSILTNNFKNIYTLFPINRLISVCIRVEREIQYKFEMEHIHFEMNLDNELFLNLLSVRVTHYKVTIGVYNETVNSRVSYVSSSMKKKVTSFLLFYNTLF